MRPLYTMRPAFIWEAQHLSSMILALIHHRVFCVVDQKILEQHEIKEYVAHALALAHADLPEEEGHIR